MFRGRLSIIFPNESNFSIDHAFFYIINLESKNGGHRIIEKNYLCRKYHGKNRAIHRKSNLGLRIKKRSDAFHELYKTSFLPLQHYAMRYLYDWKQAEDLVQDAFLSLWDHLERYDEKQPVFYYMLGIIRNNCLNYLRDLEIQGKHQDKIIEAMLFSGIEDPEIDEDIHERLKTILDTLPEKQKEVVLLHIVEKKRSKKLQHRWILQKLQ